MEELGGLPSPAGPPALATFVPPPRLETTSTA
jgi:hypothetical protein